MPVLLEYRTSPAGMLRRHPEKSGMHWLAASRMLSHFGRVKSGMRWATAILVLLNVAFFVVSLLRAPGSRTGGREGAEESGSSTSWVAVATGQAGVYSVTGVVREIGEGGTRVKIRHEAIPGYMVAMTMPFNVRDPREVASVKPGDQVTFRLLVTDEESWIDTVTRVGVAEAPPAFTYEQSRIVRDVEPLELGQMMPDYPFTNEFGAPIKLSDYRGQTVGMTFIFTRCPLPDFCPRMLKNFEEVSRRLRDPSVGMTNWHLVTLTIDPLFDTPAVLRGHAERYQYDPKRWTFLTGAVIDIDAISEQVGLMYRRQAPNALPDHNLRTLLIDAEGRLRKIIVGNTWKPEDFVADLVAVAAGKSIEKGGP